MKSFSYLCISLVFLINSYTSNAMDLDSPLESDSRVKQLAEIIREENVAQAEKAFPQYLHQLSSEQREYLSILAGHKRNQSINKCDVLSRIAINSIYVGSSCLIGIVAANVDDTTKPINWELLQSLDAEVPLVLRIPMKISYLALHLGGRTMYYSLRFAYKASIYLGCLSALTYLIATGVESKLHQRFKNFDNKIYWKFLYNKRA